MSISDYIKELQSYEEYAFSLPEIKEKCNLLESTMRKELQRLIRKEEIILLRNGFYLIIPPRYKSLKKIPLELYVDKLFQFIGKPYYVALYSAAEFYGASHQQMQKDYVITIPPALRDVSKGNISLSFVNAKNWSELNIIEKKSDAGLFKISSPALTIADLVYYHSKIGGINRILANIEELTEELTESDLRNLLSWYSNKSNLQRLGFILEEEQISTEFADLIFEHISKEPLFPTLLSNKKGEKARHANNRWKVDVNLTLESDL